MQQGVVAAPGLKHRKAQQSRVLPAALVQAQKMDVAKKELDKLCHDPGSYVSLTANQRFNRFK